MNYSQNKKDTVSSFVQDCCACCMLCRNSNEGHTSIITSQNALMKVVLTQIDYNFSLHDIPSRPFLEESCTRVPERLRNFVCASDRSSKDSQALFIPWKSKLK